MKTGRQFCLWDQDHSKKKKINAEIKYDLQAQMRALSLDPPRAKGHSSPDPEEGKERQ
jgi:hypothetical protein